MFNYLDMEISKSIAFSIFALVWTYVCSISLLLMSYLFHFRYTRHYLNLCMIWSVWNEFSLVRLVTLLSGY